MTHDHLRKRAIQWLTNTQRCSVVLSEMVAFNAANEIPDALGFSSSGNEVISHLVECKVSRADYLVNSEKPCMVVPDLGVGKLRWFMVPSGLVQPDEHRDRYPGYGLVVVRDANKQVQIAVHSEKFPAHDDSEKRMLVSALRRVKAREFLVLVQDPEAA